MNRKNFISTSILFMTLTFQLHSAQNPGAAPLTAPMASEPFQPVDLARMEEVRRDLTLRFLVQFQDPDLRGLLAARLGPGQARVPLSRLVGDWAELWPAPEHRQFAARVQELDLELRRRMGIEDTSRSVLGLRVIWPKGGPGPIAWNRTLFAIAPQARDQAPEQLEAYDSSGRPVRLDPRAAPDVPVVMIGADRREAVRAGLETVNRGLRRAGFADDHRPAAPAAPVPCAKLAAIRLARGPVHWYEDDVEAYALVSGIDPVAAKPNIKLVHLPYLRQGARDYQPNQVILFWTDFRFSAANIQVWDHGDSTDYRNILDAVLKAATAATAAAGAPLFAWIPALADAILQAMPSTWWRDADSLIDTFYTLEKDRTYQDLEGVERNLRITLVPWILQPQ